MFSDIPYVYHILVIKMYINGVSRNISQQYTNKQQRVPLSIISNGNLRQIEQQQQQIQQIRFPVIQNKEEVQQFYHIEFPIGLPYDPQDITEYEHIVYRSMRLREEYLPEFNVPQKEITSEDRSDAVHWLCRLHYKCQLTTETLHRSIGILDRVIAATSISARKLKLICSATMLIASKIEDIRPLLIRDILTIAGGEFTSDDLKKMEVNLINLIGFDTEFPTPLFFLNILL